MFFGRAASSDDLVISTANTAAPQERVRFAQNGNVGIGAAQPGAKLDVGGSFSVAAFRGNSTDAVVTFQNIAAGGSSWDVAATANGSSAGPGRFVIGKSGVAHHFTIIDNGNVGIGTINPLQKVDVNGFLRISGPTTNGIIFADGTIQTTAAGSLAFNAPDELRLLISRQQQEIERLQAELLELRATVELLRSASLR